MNGLDKIYNYPLSDDAHVIGIQANLWTERVITRERLHYMVFPRLIALAEKAWTGIPNDASQSRSAYEDFLSRLETEFRYLDTIPVYYYDPSSFSHHPEVTR